MSGFKSLAVMAAVGLSFSLAASIDATAKDITASQIPCHTIITDGGVRSPIVASRTAKGPLSDMDPMFRRAAERIASRATRSACIPSGLS